MSRAGYAHLPLTVQALLLRAFTMLPAYQSPAKEITQQLITALPDMLQTHCLRDSFTVFDALITCDRASVPGPLLAAAVKRLIAAEVAPGGPYLEVDGSFDAIANHSIYHSMKCCGVELPPTLAMLKLYPWPPTLIQLVMSAFARPLTQSAVLHPDVLRVFYRLAQHQLPVRSTVQVRSEFHIVLTRVRDCFSYVSQPLKQQLETCITTFAARDTRHEITLLALHFQQAFSAAAMPVQLWQQLGAANVCYWLAATIYDDFLDDAGQPTQLTVANLCMRQSLRLFRQAYAADPHYIERIFDDMDAANAYELMYCRATCQMNTITVQNIPDTKNITYVAKRAYAHALGPIIVARFAGISGQQQRLFEQAWQHYLIAKQLSDDIHDWTDDLAHGHMSPVVAAMLQSLQVGPGVYDLKLLQKNMQRFFWHQGLEQFVRQILWHIAQARQCFVAVHYSQLPTDLFFFCDAVEQAAHAALRRHLTEKQFLLVYKKNVS